MSVLPRRKVTRAGDTFQKGMNGVPTFDAYFYFEEMVALDITLPCAFWKLVKVIFILWPRAKIGEDIEVVYGRTGTIRYVGTKERKKKVLRSGTEIYCL